METPGFKTLLQRYYDGLTSNEEEQEISRLIEEGELSEDEILQGLQVDAFKIIRDEDIAVPDDLDDFILEGLSKVQEPSKVRNIRPLYWISSAAAVLLILMSSLIFLKPNNDLGTFSDPQLAYTETQETLDLVAMYFGKGTGQLKAVEKFDQAIKPLSSLEEVDKVSKELGHLSKLNPGIDAALKLLNGKK